MLLKFLNVLLPPSLFVTTSASQSTFDILSSLLMQSSNSLILAIDCGFPVICSAMSLTMGSFELLTTAQVKGTNEEEAMLF